MPIKTYISRRSGVQNIAKEDLCTLSPIFLFYFALRSINLLIFAKDNNEKELNRGEGEES